MENQTGFTATGSWQDSVYVSPTDAITSSAILLGSALHTGGLTGNGTYNGSLTAALPAMAPGYYYVVVEVDSRYRVADEDRANNTLAAMTGQLDVSVPALTLGQSLSDSFTAANQNRYYQVTVPAGGSLSVALTSTASSGAVALYVSQGTLPTSYDYQEVATAGNQPSQTLTVPQVLRKTATYYILAHSVSGNAATTGYTITATQTSALAVFAISPDSGGDYGSVTIEIDGTNFSPAMTASLTLGATSLSATALDFVSASQVFATFSLPGGQTMGDYTVSVQQGGQSAIAPTAFQVAYPTLVPPPGGGDLLVPKPLTIVLSTPQFVRSGRTASVVVSYTNPNNFDMVAPLLEITSTNTNVFFSTPDDPNNDTQDAQMLGVAPRRPCGRSSPRR